MDDRLRFEPLADWGFARRRSYEGAEREKRQGIDVIMASPQRIMWEVADSIWSAAVMTLAFIS